MMIQDRDPRRRNSRTSGLADAGLWHFAVDRGGTFTDILGVSPAGELHTLKLLSASGTYDDAVTEGIRRILKLPHECPLASAPVGSIRMGTTVATNALLERKGENAALVTTEGFRDAIEIGYQARPELFSLAINKPELLYSKILEIRERISARGEVVMPLVEDEVSKQVQQLREQGIRSVAVVLLHAWKNPTHESRVAALCREAGFQDVSVSHEIMPTIKMVSRGQTTLVDAYLSPVLRRYVDRVRRQTGNIRLLFMQSAGGLTEAELFSGKDAIISGPAGGVVGCAAVARATREAEVIGFDMGGTSTDVCRYDGRLERVFESTTAGISFQSPMLNVKTVAAGGGSILWFDGRKLNVGPESAGADPGPACYGWGGPLAVTDANLLLGRIQPEYFPRIFGPGRDGPLDADVVMARFSQMAETVSARLGTRMTAEDLALGFIRIANEKMCRPVKELSVARGFDIRRHALICFGGAAGQHACSIARTLGMQRILVHPLASLLSAYGIASADLLRTASESVLVDLQERSARFIESRFEALAAPLIAELEALGVKRPEISVGRQLDLRTLGTDSTLTVPYEGLEETVEMFHRAHERHFGFRAADLPVEAVSVRLEVSGTAGLLAGTENPRLPGGPSKSPDPVGEKTVWFETGPLTVPVYLWKELATGVAIQGPALFIEPNSTVVLEPGFQGHVLRNGVLSVTGTGVFGPSVGQACDPTMLEVFNHLFMSVAEQMGAVLAQTAHSTNIKERLDFSCAVFDQQGSLVANAPHIPVHLGAMGEAVKSIIRSHSGDMSGGDAYVTNDPHQGGSHLPDVTVVSPVFVDEMGPVFYVASRGHHADIGGRTPGSLPAYASVLEEEGVVLPGLCLVRRGVFREERVRTLLSAGPYPARNIPERISDLRAQLAGNQRGIRELLGLVDRYGLDTVQAYMGHIQRNAADSMEEALLQFVREGPVFSSAFEDFLDDGTRIAVGVIIHRKDEGRKVEMTIDFTGTDPQLDGNLNAPFAVTRSAVLYVLRTLISRDIPLNDGCMSPITLMVPEGTVLNPRPGSAVSGGNVETSQRVVDVLYGALGVAAASQGTMNNFLFGRRDGTGRQYYETIGGGSGALEGHDGASGVQVHMTNTRLTDPEILESRFPEVRIERFTIRRGSGGAGRFRGGDGVERAIRFLEPREITILSERRNRAPYGLHGGDPGAKGQNLLIGADGETQDLGGKVSRSVHPGDLVVIRTPGGGGFGRPESGEHV